MAVPLVPALSSFDLPVAVVLTSGYGCFVCCGDRGIVVLSGVRSWGALLGVDAHGDSDRSRWIRGSSGALLGQSMVGPSSARGEY